MTITERIFIDGEWRTVAERSDNKDDDEDASISVETDHATSSSEDSATLEGDLIELKELDDASVWFEWRESGTDSWSHTDKETRTETGSFSDEISDLDPDTEYEFRAQAENEEHNVSDTGETKIFSTDEEGEASISVETKSATSISADSAILNGELAQLDHTEEADVWFEWGQKDEDFPNATDTQTLTDTQEFAEDLENLESETEYEYRAHAVAEDGAVTDEGGIETFTTDDEGETGEIVAEEDLFAHWEIAEGSGQTVFEVESGEHDGTLAGGVEWDDSKTWPREWGLENKDPVEGEDYVETTTWGDFFGGSDAVANGDFALSIAFWTIDDGSYMISATHNGDPLMRVGTRHAWGWAVNKQGFKFYLSSNPGKQAATGELNGTETNVDDGGLYHVVINKGGQGSDDWEMFINGTAEPTADHNTDGSALGDINHEATADITFFADTIENDYREPTEMGIGYVALWNRTLSEQEIKDEYSRMPFSED